MRKTLRALFMGVAMAATTLPAIAQTPGMPQGPRPPSAEQQQQYEQLQGTLLRELQLDAAAVHALEVLEDDFYAGKISADDFHAQRADMLLAMFPELGNPYEEFEGPQNRLVGCTTDGVSIVIHVVTMVKRADIDALFERLAGKKGQNGSTVRYINAIADMSNILRQQMEKASDDLIGKQSSADLQAANFADNLNAALTEATRRATVDTHIDMQVRPLGVQTPGLVCRQPEQAVTPAPFPPAPPTPGAVTPHP